MLEEPAINRAVSLLLDSKEWRTYPPHTRRWIDPGSVLAYLWHEGRVREAIRLLNEGQKAPPIVVSKVMVQVPGKRRGVYLTYYLVTDGNARTIAARLSSVKVLAEIDGEYRVSSERFGIRQNMLWRQIDSNTATLCGIGPLTPDITVELEKLGVANWDKGTDPWGDHENQAEDFWFEHRGYFNR